MPRRVEIEEKNQVILMIKEGRSQRDIALETGLSRPYIRKIAKQMIGHSFPRNGIEKIGQLCLCTNCSGFFRRSPSRVACARQQFCSVACKSMGSSGVNSSSWKTGESAKSFSTWISNQQGYKDWRSEVIKRSGGVCAVTGLPLVEGSFDVHHLKMKSQHQELALEPSNGICVERSCHRLIHKFLSEGQDFLEAVESAKKEVLTKKG